MTRASAGFSAAHEDLDRLGDPLQIAFAEGDEPEILTEQEIGDCPRHADLSGLGRRFQSLTSYCT
jgi:hypothetical protein